MNDIQSLTSSANNDLNIMFYGLIGFILLVFILTALAKLLDRHNDKYLKHLEQEEKKLEILIKSRQETLQRLENEIEYNTINNDYKLNNTTMEVLDMYEYSLIRVPVEIIEELSHLKLGDKDQIVNYIENQRGIWKLENSKRLMRMDVKA